MCDVRTKATGGLKCNIFQGGMKHFQFEATLDYCKPGNKGGDNSVVRAGALVRVCISLLKTAWPQNVVGQKTKLSSESLRELAEQETRETDCCAVWGR